MQRPKIVIIALIGVVVIVIGVFLAVNMSKSAQSKNMEAFYGCMYECNIEDAKAYANKLKDTYYNESVSRLERFLSLYEAGSWQEAIAEFDGGGDFLRDGKANAFYCECYYQTIMPLAEKAVNEGLGEDAVKLLLKFQDRFYGNSHFDLDSNTHVGNYDNYTEHFPEHGRNFIRLTEKAAKMVLAEGNENTIALLEGFAKAETWDRTIPFEKFPWSADYLAWKETSKAKETGEGSATGDAEELTLPQGGGSGSYDSTGLVTLNVGGDNYTYRILSAGMLPGGGYFGLYVIPVSGEISRIKGKDSMGNPETEVLIKALTVDDSGKVIRPISTNANTNMSDPSKTRITYLFDIKHPKNLFLYPSLDKEGGALIPVGSFTPEKTTGEVTWE